MREHEVPTHVQAEDRVLLWFTFPQVVAMVAYGVVELVMNAVVGNPVDPNLPTPATPTPTPDTSSG